MDKSTFITKYRKQVKAVLDEAMDNYVWASCNELPKDFFDDLSEEDKELLLEEINVYVPDRHLRANGWEQGIPSLKYVADIDFASTFFKILLNN